MAEDNSVDQYGLGATVLQIAIVKQSKAMVELLLDYNADPNQPEQVFISSEDFVNGGFENRDHIFFPSRSNACIIGELPH